MQHSRVRIGIRRVVRLSSQTDAITKPCENYDSVSDRSNRKLRTWLKGTHPEHDQPHNPTKPHKPRNPGNRATRETAVTRVTRVTPSAEGALESGRHLDSLPNDTYYLGLPLLG
jgi:hypothetical protein